MVREWAVPRIRYRVHFTASRCRWQELERNSRALILVRRAALLACKQCWGVREYSFARNVTAGLCDRFLVDAGGSLLGWADSFEGPPTMGTIALRTTLPASRPESQNEQMSIWLALAAEYESSPSYDSAQHVRRPSLIHYFLGLA